MTDYNEKQDNMSEKNHASILVPFIMITACFVLWGFANDITGVMVKAFSKIFRMNVTDGAMVQVAFYFGYFAMAFPAAMFIQKYSFKAGVLVGLTIYGIGTLLFFPAKMMGMYEPFLIAYFIVTCGLSFLETSCNTYIYCMGDESDGVRRLNFAQAFNPLGALAGMYIAMQYVQNRISPLDSAARAVLPEHQFEFIKNHDLNVLIRPYIAIGILVIVIALIIKHIKMPKNGDTHIKKDFGVTIKELFSIKNYRDGVTALFFYMGAQVTCWTFIIQYGSRIFMAEGMNEKAAEMLSQKYNIAAMILFACSRFVCTWFMKYVHPAKLLAILASVGVLAVAGVILFTDRNGIYCLVIVSGCLSLMFPTIFGLALHGLGDDVKFGGAGLITAMIGGSIFVPVHAMIIDSNISILKHSSVNISFIIPFVCFIIIASYGYRYAKRDLQF